MIDKKAIKMNWSIVTRRKTPTNRSKLITGSSDDVNAS